jgi:hypothetical protein
LYPQKFRIMSRVLAMAFVASLPCSLAAQVTPSQAIGNPNAPVPKWDIFVGYSILDPRGTFYPIQPDGSALPVSFKVEKTGVIEGVDYFITPHIGMQVEVAQHDLFTNTGFASTGSSNSGIFTLAGGVIYRWPGVHFTPFVHGFAGGADVDGPDHEPYTWGPIVGGGGGLDWYFGCHFGVRLFEADYEFLHANSGVSSGTLANDNFVWADDENVNAIRVSTGLVFRGASAWGPLSGCGALPPPAMTCVAAPGAVYPGAPVTITANASGLNPKKTATYSWSGAGASGSGNVATVETASLAPGTYTVHSTVTEGPKHPESADCSASFTILPWAPPTLTCAAGPMTIHADQTSTITLTGRSPQNRPLTYTCTSSAGKMEMAGSTGTFSANGAPEGPVTISCIVADDKGQTANCNASVTIQSPPIVIHHVQPLCSLDFSKDTKHPNRVDNEAKACLDEISLTLQQNPAETLVVVGEAAGNEAQGATGSAAHRAVNTKEYLTTEKGIDPSRITVVTGGDATLGVQDYIVPQGVNFNADVPNTTPVNEDQVKPDVRKPLPARPDAKKPATPKTPPDPNKKKPAAAPTQPPTGP